MRILVSLVSAQTIPNVEFILQMKGKVDKYLFISTASMERDGNREWIMKAADISENQLLPTIVVNPVSFEDIEQKLSEQIDENHEYLVNITGGTKVMSLRVDHFFRDLQSSIFYLPGNGTYLQIHPGKGVKTFDLNVSLSVDQYLQSYGFDVESKSTPLLDFEYAQHFYNQYIEHQERYRTVLTELQRCRSKKNTTINKIQGLANFLEEVNFTPSNEGKLTKYEVRYLTGDWFEEYVYYRLLKEVGISEDYLGLGYQIKKADVPNEFDILFVHNNRLYAIECKTSIFTEVDGRQKSFIGEVLYKSDSLQKGFGLYTSTSIITVSDILDGEGKVLQPLKKHMERADLNRINVVAQRDLNESLAHKLGIRLN
ncbi:Card1-like endonuclease domain-containing protein [Algivirga pacifica]|uniref:DUF1887 family CARF protein n=1 Tax=Algivirga pacifica TaxID=1162670 RepID=A0ABP9D6I5_9BACT